MSQINSRTTTVALVLSLVCALGLVAGCGGGGGTPPSSNATLSALVLESGALTPGFDPATKDYTVAVGLFLPSLTLTPTTADAGASIEVDGQPVASGAASQSLPLSVGPTPVLIQVTAADGSTTETYNLVVTRAATASQEAYIKASNTGAADELGFSMASDGNTLVVGAFRESSNATGVNGDEADNLAGGSGAVYVFVRSGTTWTQQAYLKASNTEASDTFGYSVDISGDTIVVGAVQEGSNATGIGGDQADNSAAGSGAAYVFVRSGTTWAQQAYLKASNTGAGDFFGFSVAASGHTIVVGAREEDSNATGVGGDETDNSAVDSGAAYVFVRSGTTWMQQAYLKASNTDAGDNFGVPVKISGDTIAVAASKDDSNATGVNGDQADNSAADAGAVYVFVRSGATWTQQAYLKASNAQAGDRLGGGTGLEELALDGDTLAVGSPWEASNATGINGDQSDNSLFGAGAVYVFVRSGTTWTQQAYIKASNTEANDFFGHSLEVAGDLLVAGTLPEASNATGIGGDQTDNSATRAGAVYVFVRSGTAWTQIAYVKASNTEQDDNFGSATTILGDSVIVGASGERSNATGINGNQANNSAFSSGAVYVLR